MVTAPSTRLILGLLATLGLSGCAQNASYRSNPRSIASVGDKTETIVTGEPGASIASTVPDLPGGNARDTTISGRVVDERGRPIPRAKVRLAVAGVKGGRAETVKADSSGGFTLHQLKRGATYVVIAEAIDGDETLVGRTEVKAPQSSVRVQLHARADGTNSFRTSSNSSRTPISPASNISDDDENGDDRNSRQENRSYVNEDIDPPAPEASSVRRGRSRPSRDSSIDRESASSQDFDAEDDVEVELPRSSRERRTRKSQIPATLHPDDQDDEFPPAREADPSDEASNVAPSELGGQAPVVARADQADETRGDRGGQSWHSTERRGAESKQDTEVMTASTSVPARASVEAFLNRENVSTTAPDSTNQVAEVPAELDVPLAPAQEAPSPMPRELDHVESDAASSASVAPRLVEKQTPSRPVVKWAEIDRDQDVPLDESLRKRPSTTNKPAEPVVQESPARKVAPKTEKGLLSRLFRPQPVQPIVPAMCRYDSASRQLHDFDLPDANGQKISLKSFDSDLILLDFWGTWCAPCRTSIPKLVEIQNRFGKKRVQIIGIACERETSDRRFEIVAKAQRDLGINYPVAITTKDGPCPLQEAMQIQFYPTMILLDREGRVLWREQGATETTLFRMERAINSTPQ